MIVYHEKMITEKPSLKSTIVFSLISPNDFKESDNKYRNIFMDVIMYNYEKFE